MDNNKKSKKVNSKGDLRLVIQKRIDELTAEIQTLLQKKQTHQEVMKEVDIRLTQLVGAIEELSNLIRKN